MHKVFAKQVPPEWQYEELEYPDNVIFMGNRDFDNHIPEDYGKIMKALTEGDLYDDLCSVWKYSEMLEVTNAYFGRDDYNAEEIVALRSALIAYKYREYREQSRAIADYLSAVFKEEWKTRIIRGYSQSDWQQIYYPANEWTDNDIRILEMDYFGEYSIYEIHWGIEEPENPEDIDGYYMRTYSGDPKAEIAQYECVKPEEVKLYTFAGWIKTPKYREV